MKKIFCLIISLVLIHAANAQTPYLDKIYHVGPYQSWSENVFLEKDSSYFLIGSSVNYDIDCQDMVGLRISPDGDTVRHQHLFSIDSVDLAEGSPGVVKRLSSGNYYMPLYTLYLNTFNGNTYDQAAGMAMTDSTGDTLFVKNYTDTSLYYEWLGDIIQLPDGGYMLCGQRNYKSSGAALGLLVRTDAAGNYLWSKVYDKISSEQVQLSSLELLPDGKVLIGASSISLVWYGSSTYYYRNKPWFIIADTAGTIIKDTLFDDGFAGGGTIHRDLRGGYYQYGQLDIFDSTNSYAAWNLPPYVAHLDTNFRVVWITTFMDSVWGDNLYQVKQLSDSNYLAMGSKLNSVIGWASKVGKAGNIKWDKTYPSESGYLYSCAELAQKKVVLTGSRTDTSVLPHEDAMWLLIIDSNGCEMPGCDDTGLVSPPVDTSHYYPPVIPPATVGPFRLWPNPSYGQISVQSPVNGSLVLYNVIGQRIATYILTTGVTEISMPSWLASGIYTARYLPDGGSARQTVKIVYEP